jgi:hypothetical protein
LFGPRCGGWVPGAVLRPGCGWSFLLWPFVGGFPPGGGEGCGLGLRRPGHARGRRCRARRGHDGGRAKRSSRRSSAARSCCRWRSFRCIWLGTITFCQERRRRPSTRTGHSATGTPIIVMTVGTSAPTTRIPTIIRIPLRTTPTSFPTPRLRRPPDTPTSRSLRGRRCSGRTRRPPRARARRSHVRDHVLHGLPRPRGRRPSSPESDDPRWSASAVTARYRHAEPRSGRTMELPPLGPIPRRHHIQSPRIGERLAPPHEAARRRKSARALGAGPPGELPEL